MLPYAYHPQMLVPTPSELLGAIAPPPPPIPRRAPPEPTANRTETQRRARQRAVAEEIGFVPTDPDSISSHEKKRHYLECLEHYVLYLHEQLRLVQIPPLALERVSTYRGLSSRSIRTLLVYMQNVNKTLYQNILAEEQMFLDLSADVKAAHSPGIPQRSHSADVVATSDYTPLPHQAFLGPDGATYQCLDDPHASIPAGYFGSL